MLCCSRFLTANISAMKVTVWYVLPVWLLILGPGTVACLPASLFSPCWQSSPCMFLTSSLLLCAERDAPIHGITQEHPPSPPPCLTSSGPTQLLYVSPRTGNSFTASCSPGCTPPHPAAPGMPKALSVMVMVDSFPSPFTTHISPSPAPITKSLQTNFQGRQESLEAPSGPQVERQWGKRER